MAQHPINKNAQAADGLTQGEAISVAIAVTWMVVVGIFFWLLPPSENPDAGFDALRRILMFVAIFMPVGLIWVAAIAARSSRALRDEIYRLQVAVDGLRQTQLAQHAIQSLPQQSVETVREASGESQAALSPPVSGFTSRREVSRLIVPRAAPQAPIDQPAFELGLQTEETAPPLERRDLIQALHFPNDEHDTEGFAALRRALRDRSARRLVQASQDVLTLLSQDGIYTDDLHPDPISADLWRRFAKGERGKTMERLGAIREHAAIASAAGRMREDTIFRDAVHHFLRRFDEMLVTFEEHATDTDLLALAETRTARAFMLLGRATGTFD